MERKVDARGLACPLPVINTKKVLDELPSGTVITVVDNPVARDNLLRLANSTGCIAQVEEGEREFTVTFTKGENSGLSITPVMPGEMAGSQGEQVVFIGSATLGRGEEELGRILMRSFIVTLTESAQRPDCLIFVNSGVKLTTEGSEVLEFLNTLADRGCELLSCGTCLDFFGLKDKLAVGRISNMYEILEKMQQAGKLINV